MALEHCTMHCHIFGKVQGVYYRASTLNQATALGLTGWVRNEPDGSVSLMATGPREQLAALEHWCWQGPPGARVTEVIRTDCPQQAFPAFEVRR